LKPPEGAPLRGRRQESQPGARGQFAPINNSSKKIRFSWEIQTPILDSIAIEPRALGVSSTLAPWGMNEEEDFMIEKCEKMGVLGDPPRMLPPSSLGREGVTFTNSTERFKKGFQKNQYLENFTLITVIIGRMVNVPKSGNP